MDVLSYSTFMPAITKYYHAAMLVELFDWEHYNNLSGRKQIFF